MQDIIFRTRDVSDVVRKQAYTVLAAKAKMTDLSMEERALLLRQGLHDRSSGVVSSAVALVQDWLVQGCGESVLDLLSCLDVRHFPGLYLQQFQYIGSYLSFWWQF